MVFILYPFLRFSWKAAINLFIKKPGQLLWEYNSQSPITYWNFRMCTHCLASTLHCKAWLSAVC